MSCIIAMIPLAVAINATLLSASAAVLAESRSDRAENRLPALETAFADKELLCKTLTQHGLQVAKKSENEMLVTTEAGTLRYFREGEGMPFYLELSDITNLQQLQESLEELENEYGRNVQTFTYHKVMQGLAEHGMCLDSEEILEDDSIVLTLNL